MSFRDFHGNPTAVTRVREMIARERFPQAAIIAGPEGAGKYTLALMCALALNCLEQPQSDGLPDYCGSCENCEQIGQLADLNTRFAEAVEAREGLRETDKKETRILLQTHPDVMVVPPDPPQMLIKVGQVRKVIDSIYYRPARARRKVYVFTEASFMKEAANSLLKVLEEPPEYASIVLLATNPGELLTTIRSRCVMVTLGALPTGEVEEYLSQNRRDLKPPQRALVARLSEGAIGRAKAFDLAGYISARTDALVLLRTAIQGDDHSELFKITETYRAGGEGKDKTNQLISTSYSLLEDLLLLRSGTPELIRNTDIEKELISLANQVSFEWLEAASRGLSDVESGMRRNLLRSLSLDAFATSLER